MRIFAVDPGQTTGIAVYDTDWQRVVATYEMTEPASVGDFIDMFDCPPPKLTVVVEAFPGGGPRTAAAVHTLKVLGFVEHYARHLGFEVVLQQPQRRLHKLEEARKLLPNGGRHSLDALAHALAFSSGHGRIRQDADSD